MLAALLAIGCGEGGGGVARDLSATDMAGAGATDMAGAGATDMADAKQVTGDGGCAPAPDDASTREPRGVYLADFPSQTPLASPSFAPALAVPGVDGVFLNRRWLDVQPLAGVPDFTKLDADIQTAVTAKLKVSISVSAGAGAPAWFCASNPSSCVPFVVYDTPNQSCVKANLPVPWDATFQSAWASLIGGLATHLQADALHYAALTVVKITGINANSAELILPAGSGVSTPCLSGDACDPTTHTCTPTDGNIWAQSYGYTPSVPGAAYNAWVSLANLFDSSFPTKVLDVQVTAKGFPNDTNRALVGAMVAYGEQHFPARFAVQDNGLNATGGYQPEVVAAAMAGVTSGFQMLDYVHNNSRCLMKGTLTNIPAGTCPELVLADAVDFGIGKGAKFLEFYIVDAIHFPNTVLCAHQRLVH